MADVEYRYGTWRSHQVQGLSWHLLQPTQGGYLGTGSDQGAMVLDWTAADALVSAADAAGVDICWNFYMTPAWASVAADQVNGSNTYSNPWGVAGGPAVPAKLQYLRDIVSAVLARYNAGRKRIAFVEPMNEPEFFSAAELAGRASAYWTGTAAQAVDYVWAVRQTVQAFDASIPTLCPSQYSADRLTAFLTATGPVSGKKGWDVFDWLNIHPYTLAPNQAIGGSDIWWSASPGIGIASANRLLLAAGAQTAKPVAITEWGINVSSGTMVDLFNGRSSAEKFTYIARLAAMAALNGCPLFTIFSFGTLAGDYTTDTDGVIAAVTDVHTKLAGQTVVSGGYDVQTGAVHVVLASGQEWVW